MISLSVDFVENRQGHVQILHATFHILDTGVDLRVYNFELLKVFLNISLLHSILVPNVLCKVIRNTFKSHLVLRIASLINALTVFTIVEVRLPLYILGHISHLLPFKVRHLHQHVDLISKLRFLGFIRNFHCKSFGEAKTCGIRLCKELCLLREMINILLCLRCQPSRDNLVFEVVH